MATLDADSALVAAYADVQSMTGPPAQREAGHVFALDFDPARLQLENFLPIHAVLFRREVVEQSPACRFDTDLQLFEDWDFWLQLAIRGPFRRVPGVSAIYALSTDEGSGHAHIQGVRRQRMLEQLAIRQLAQEKRTMVIVTHEMSFARDVADRAIFMDQGRIVEQGPAKSLFANPQQPRTRQFLEKFLMQ